jgi:hypothetical protein
MNKKCLFVDDSESTFFWKNWVNIDSKNILIDPKIFKTANTLEEVYKKVAEELRNNNVEQNDYFLITDSSFWVDPNVTPDGGAQLIKYLEENGMKPERSVVHSVEPKILEEQKGDKTIRAVFKNADNAQTRIERFFETGNLGIIDIYELAKEIEFTLQPFWILIDTDDDAAVLRSMKQFKNVDGSSIAYKIETSVLFDEILKEEFKEVLADSEGDADAIFKQIWKSILDALHPIDSLKNKSASIRVLWELGRNGYKFGSWEPGGREEPNSVYHSQYQAFYRYWNTQLDTISICDLIRTAQADLQKIMEPIEKAHSLSNVDGGLS